MTAPVVIVVPDADVLAAAVAARLLSRLADAQAARGTASLVLTGGTIGIAALESLRDSPALTSVNWSRVDFWWGDERFVAADSPDRNDVQARAALLGALDLDAARIHHVEPLGGRDGADPAAAAERYVDELRAAATDGSQVPSFDVLLLGMGPEGHTASIFPESPAVSDERIAFAVEDCPKPPPTRVSMGFTAITCAREVWLVVSGQDKAPAVARALSGTDRVQSPAAGATGRERTLWLVDEAAASALSSRTI